VNAVYERVMTEKTHLTIKASECSGKFGEKLKAPPAPSTLDAGVVQSA
jgi:hypothetical protein